MLRPFLQTLAALLIAMSPEMVGAPHPEAIQSGRLLACLIIPLTPLLFLLRRSAGPAGHVYRGRLAAFLPLLPLGLHALVLHGLGWTGIVAAAGLRTVPVVYELALLYPYLLAVSSAEAVGVGTGRGALPPVAWWRRVAWRWRRETLVLVPFLAFVALDGLLGIDPIRRYSAVLPVLTWGAILVLFVLLGLGFPFLMAWGMGWRALPRDAAWRGRLEAMLAAHRFSCRDILLWRTGGLITNAAIVGITPRTRFIMVSDGLLSGLEVDELEAVLAHEVGHGHRRHVPLFAAFALGWLLLLREADAAVAHHLTGLAGTLTTGGDLVLALLWLAGLFLGFGVIFGGLSRRFEREADLFAASHGGGAALFVRALRRVSNLAGISPRRRFWRHDSTETRVAFLERVTAATGAGSRRHFERQMRAVRLGIGGMVVVAGVLFFRSMLAGSLVGFGSLAFDREDWTVAARRVAQGIEIGERSPAAYRLLLEAYRRAGRLDEACELAGFLTTETGPGGAPGEELVRNLEALAEDLASAGRDAAGDRIRSLARRLEGGRE